MKDQDVRDRGALNPDSRSRDLHRWWLAPLVVSAATLGLSLVPVRGGVDVGNSDFSCGSLWSAVFAPRANTGLEAICHEQAGTRLVLLAVAVAPLLLLWGAWFVVVWARRGRAHGEVLPSGGESADLLGALAHLAFLVLPVIPAVVIFVLAKNDRVRRHAATAIDVQAAWALLVLSMAVEMTLVDTPSVNPRIAVLMLVLSAAAGLTSIVCAVGCVFRPTSLGWWRPTLWQAPGAAPNPSGSQASI